MMDFKFRYSPPALVKNIFKAFQWEAITDEVLLTFDDGPNPITTEIILKELDRLSINAVFFCVGENIYRYPEIAKEILSAGHEIGNHTDKHRMLTSMQINEAVESIGSVQRKAADILGYQIRYFRPPHGRFNFYTKNILNKMALINVMWSLLTYDYKNDLNIVKFAVSNYLEKNSIVALHDNIKSKSIIRDSINIIVENAEKKSFTIGKPVECLRPYSQ